MFRRYLIAYDLSLPLYLSPEDGKGGGGGDDQGDSLAHDLADLEDDSGDDTSSDDGDDDKGGGDGDGEGDSGDAGEDDDDEKEDKEDEDKKDDEDEDDDKSKKGKKEDEPELDEHGRPTFKTLRAEYPELFKKFPGLKAAFFEYPKYQEIFSDVEDAQLASVKAQEYDTLETALVGKGDASLLFKTLEENNPKALKKLIENIPEAVRSIDDDLYTDLAKPFIDELLFYANKQGEKIGGQNGKNLILAARHIANFMYANGGEIPDISKRSVKDKEPSEAEKELEVERARNNTREFERAFTDVGGKIDTDINAILGNKLNDLTSFERKQVIKEARQEIDKTLKADKAFQKVLSSLWRKAAEDGYSDQSKSRLKRAWLDRAKVIAASTRNRLRQEALDARTPGKGDSDEEKPGKKRTFPNRGGQEGRKSSGFADPKKIDWKKTSDLDILG
jgi:hypothetical protein